MIITVAMLTISDSEKDIRGGIPASCQLLYYQAGGLPEIYRCGAYHQRFLD